jgi:hypothetical protein
MLFVIRQLERTARRPCSSDNGSTTVVPTLLERVLVWLRHWRGGKVRIRICRRSLPK